MNGQVVFPGDVAVWEDHKTHTVYKGLVLFQHSDDVNKSTSNVQGLFLKILESYEIIRILDLSSELCFPVIVSNLYPIVNNRNNPHYLNGEKIKNGDIVEVDNGGERHQARVKLILGKCDDEPWEKGDKVFIELEYINLQDAPTIFSYTDRNDRFISSIMQEINLVFRGN